MYKYQLYKSKLTCMTVNIKLEQVKNGHVLKESLYVFSLQCLWDPSVLEELRLYDGNQFLDHLQYSNTPPGSLVPEFGQWNLPSELQHLWIYPPNTDNGKTLDYMTMNHKCDTGYRLQRSNLTVTKTCPHILEQYI